MPAAFRSNNGSSEAAQWFKRRGPGRVYAHMRRAVDLRGLISAASFLHANRFPVTSTLPSTA